MSLNFKQTVCKLKLKKIDINIKKFVFIYTNIKYTIEFESNNEINFLNLTTKKFNNQSIFNLPWILIPLNGVKLILWGGL